MARLNALVDAGVQTHVRGNSVWIGNPGIKIRDANGVLTPAGERYEQLMEAANQRAETRVFHHAAQPVGPSSPAASSASGTAPAARGS